MDYSSFSQVISILTQSLSVRLWSQGYTPFEVLVSTIISQNTSRAGTIKGFEGLRARFELTPEVLAQAPVEQIRECLRPAGLYNQKAVKIQHVAQVILEEHGGDLNAILRLPLKEARGRLLELPGVGQKTADVLLNFIAGYGTFPVDTHIARIAKRWRLVDEKAHYGRIRERLEKLVPKARRTEVHLLLIEFGRTICRARGPKCSVCPVREYCSHAQEVLSHAL